MTKHYSKKRKLKYLHQYAKGATVAEISKASGVHPNTIYNWLKRFPIKSVKKRGQIFLKEYRDLSIINTQYKMYDILGLYDKQKSLKKEYQNPIAQKAK